MISDSQRDAILGRYVAAQRLPTVVLTLGVLMIGLGVLTFIAANWRELPAWLKIAMITGFYAASVAAAYFFERAGRLAASELSLFFSGFMLMGGLALNSQVFHVEMEISSLLSVWLVAFAPTLLLTRRISAYVLYEVAALLFLNSFCGEFVSCGSYENESGFRALLAIPFRPYQPTLVMAFLIAVAWCMRRESGRGEAAAGQSRMRMFFLGGSTRAIFWSNFFIINWFTWMCVINSRDSGPLPYILSILFIGAVIEAVSRKLDAGDLDLQGFLLIAAAAFSLTCRFAWDGGRFYGSGEDFLVKTIASSIALAAYLVFRIVRRRRFGGVSVFLFCIILARWYFDMFQSFRSKSMFFTIGGIALLAIAFAYRKWVKYAARKQGAGESAPSPSQEASRDD
jgi:uncharacterized membrane protein